MISIRSRVDKTPACALALSVGLAAAGWAQKVRMDTSMGEIVVELDAGEGTADGGQLRRVRQGRVLRRHRLPSRHSQLHDPGRRHGADMQEKTTRAPIPLESKSGLVNVRGSLAMARTSNPNSATAQFFINLKDNGFLDAANSPDGNGYAVFGKVVTGMDVVDKTGAVPTTTKGPHQNVPATPRDHPQGQAWRNEMGKTVEMETSAGPSASSSTTNGHR